MRSTVGRPRRTTDEQVTIILNWHAEYVAWMSMRPTIATQRDLARVLGLSTTAINRIIRERGGYKQPSPEKRSAEQKRRKEKSRQLRARRQRP